MRYLARTGSRHASCLTRPTPRPSQVGKLIELMGSKAAVLSGKWQYGTAFGEPSGLASK